MLNMRFDVLVCVCVCAYSVCVTVAHGRMVVARYFQNRNENTNSVKIKKDNRKQFIHWRV